MYAREGIASTAMIYSDGAIVGLTFNDARRAPIPNARRWSLGRLCLRTKRNNCRTVRPIRCPIMPFHGDMPNQNRPRSVVGPTARIIGTTRCGSIGSFAFGVGMELVAHADTILRSLRGIEYCGLHIHRFCRKGPVLRTQYE